MTKIEEIEKRRAERQSKQAAARKEQEAVDLEEIDALEEKTGETLHTMSSQGFAPGVAVRIAFRPPKSGEYKRYCDQVGQASVKNNPIARRAAQELLAKACWVYPADDEKRAAVCEAFPGTLISMAVEVAKVAEMQGADEGKG